MAWLVKHSVDLECVHGSLYEFLSELDHEQSEDQFIYTSFLSDEPD